MSDAESIRSRIKRRVRWLAALAALGWLTFPLSAALNRGHPEPLYVLCGMVPFLGGIFGFQYAIKCPRCRTRMGQEIGMRIGLSIWGKEPNFCPYCGVSLDEPCSREASPKETTNPVPSQNPIR